MLKKLLPWICGAQSLAILWLIFKYLQLYQFVRFVVQICAAQ